MRQHLHTRPLTGEVSLRARLEDESRGQDTQQVDQKEQSLREELKVRLQGDYYHRKLVEFDLRAGISLDQRDTDSSSGLSERSVDAQNLTYNLQTRWFKDLPYSGEFYTYRSTSESRQSFFATTESTVQETGAVVRAKEWWIPSKMKVSHYEYDGGGLDTFEQVRDSLEVTGTRTEEHANYQYTVGLDDIDFGSGGQGFRSTVLSATSFHRVGEDQEDRWTNNFRFRSQTGAADTDSIDVTSSYQVQHSDTLTSKHDLQYTTTSISGADTDTVSVSSGLSHQLFRSLSSNVSARLGTSTFEGGELETAGTQAQVAYRKQTPIGILSMRYSADFYVRDQTSDGGTVAVTDEAHLVELGIPILLLNANVVEASVFVTDSTGLVLYQRGLHYQLSAEGADMRIDVIVGVPGGIAAGDTILVDYNFLPVPGLRFDSLAQTSRASFNIKDYADISIGHTTVDQRVLEGADAGTLGDSARTTASLRVYPFGTTLGVEYESLESIHTPFKRLNYLAAYQVPLGQSASWRMSGSTFRTTFEGDPQEERGTTVSTDVFASLGRNFSGSLRGEWHEIDFRTDAGSGLVVEANLSRHFRASQLTLLLRMVDEEFDVATDIERTTVEVKFTRRF